MNSKKDTYGKDEYERRRNAKLDAAWMSNEKTKQYYKDKYGYENYQAKMDQALKLRKYGITDQKEIDKAIKLMDKNNGLSEKEAAAVMKFRKGLTKDDMITSPEKVKEAAMHMGLSSKNAERVVGLVGQTFDVKNLKVQEQPTEREEVYAEDHRARLRAGENNKDKIVEKASRGQVHGKAKTKEKAAKENEKLNKRMQQSKERNERMKKHYNEAKENQESDLNANNKDKETTDEIIINPNSIRLNQTEPSVNSSESNNNLEGNTNNTGNNN